jgi:PadR family transcriptional regulator, regulatory protein PadR
MDGPVRVTNPLLDVLAVLLAAFEDDRREMHGWAIMKATARSGPTVYGVLDRLEDAHLITGRWEDHHPQLNRRRRFYQLTPTGAVSASRLVAGRRLPHGTVHNIFFKKIAAMNLLYRSSGNPRLCMSSDMRAIEK